MAVRTNINASNRNKQSKNQEEQKFVKFRNQKDSEVNKLHFLIYLMNTYKNNIMIKT